MCGNNNAIKQLFIKNKSQILILQLKRFIKLEKNNQTIKNRTFVKVSKKIKLEEYCCLDSEREQISLNYELSSIVNHTGTMRTGHYSSYIEKRKKWFHIDDQKYQQVINIDNINTQENYILFYLHKEDD